MLLKSLLSADSAISSTVITSRIKPYRWARFKQDSPADADKPARREGMSKIGVIRYENLDLWKNIRSSYQIAFSHKYAAVLKKTFLLVLLQPGLGRGLAELKMSGLSLL